MSDERFVCIDISYGDDWYITDNGKRLSEMEIVDLLNELSTSCRQLEGEVKSLNAFLVHKGFAEEYIRWKREGEKE